MVDKVISTVARQIRDEEDKRLFASLEDYGRPVIGEATRMAFIMRELQREQERWFMQHMIMPPLSDEQLKEWQQAIDRWKKDPCHVVIKEKSMSFEDIYGNLRRADKKDEKRITGFSLRGYNHFPQDDFGFVCQDDREHSVVKLQLSAHKLNRPAGKDSIRKFARRISSLYALPLPEVATALRDISRERAFHNGLTNVMRVTLNQHINAVGHEDDHKWKPAGKTPKKANDYSRAHMNAALGVVNERTVEKLRAPWMNEKDREPVHNWDFQARLAAHRQDVQLGRDVKESMKVYGLDSYFLHNPETKEGTYYTPPTVCGKCGSTAGCMCPRVEEKKPPCRCHTLQKVGTAVLRELGFRVVANEDEYVACPECMSVYLLRKQKPIKSRGMADPM